MHQTDLAVEFSHLLKRPVAALRAVYLIGDSTALKKFETLDARAASHIAIFRARRETRIQVLPTAFGRWFFKQLSRCATIGALIEKARKNARLREALRKALTLYTHYRIKRVGVWKQWRRLERTRPSMALFFQKVPERSEDSSTPLLSESTQ